MKILDPTLIPEAVEGVDKENSLDVMAKLVLSAVDGRNNIDKIKNLYGLDETLSQKIVLDLLAKGLIQLPGFEQKDSHGDTSENTKKGNLETEINDIYDTLKTTNFYDLLGIEPDAPRQELRTRYFTLSKRFHPDKAFGNDSKFLRKRMDAIFRKLTEAYETLSRSKSREEYDASIADELEMRALEKKLKSAIEQRPKEPSDTEDTNRDTTFSSKKPVQQKNGGKVSRENAVSEPEAAATAANPIPGSPSFAPNTGGENASQSRSTTSNRPRPSNPAHDERRKKWQRERAGRAMAAILNRNSAAPPSLSSLKVHLRDAEVAIEQERFGDALCMLSEVLAADPENEKAKTLVCTAQKGHSISLTQSFLRKGIMEMRQGNLTAAEACFKQALDTHSDNLEAKHLLSEALLQQKRDLGKALSLMKEVIAKGGNRARYYITFGDLILMGGDNIRAKEAFSRALALEPGNKDAKKKLKACGK